MDINTRCKKGVRIDSSFLACSCVQESVDFEAQIAHIAVFITFAISALSLFDKSLEK